MSIIKFVVPVLGLLMLSAVPARSADAATADDTARYIAGLPPAPESPLTPLTKNPYWQQHAKFFDSIFGQNEKLHLSLIRDFTKANLKSPRETMFYMFAGPDALHAVAFFPDAST